MPRFSIILFLMLLLIRDPVLAQGSESSLNIFGYFQSSFQQSSAIKFRSTHPKLSSDPQGTAHNSFNLQQLNLFMSKDITRHWRAFINFEILNTFSSQRRWGAFNLEEAWIRYKSSDKFDLKIGLLIPVFNNLNTIKNRTPLLPYVIRPVLYESSFSEFVSLVEEGTPNRAFVEISGLLPTGNTKLEYAFYIGNSPNINDQSDRGQTGVDTTTTFLVGGRVGIRHKDLKFGFSATHDKPNLRYEARDLAKYEFIFNEVSRVRLGGDLSFHIGQFSFEGEFIKLNYGDVSEIRIDGEISETAAGEVKTGGEFYYGTLEYQFNERLLAYGSYWYLHGDFIFIASQIPRLFTTVGTEEFEVPTVGIAYKLDDRIIFKGQYVYVNSRVEKPLEIGDSIKEKSNFNLFALAVSVFF